MKKKMKKKRKERKIIWNDFTRAFMLLHTNVCMKWQIMAYMSNLFSLCMSCCCCFCCAYIVYGLFVANIILLSSFFVFIQWIFSINNSPNFMLYTKWLVLTEKFFTRNVFCVFFCRWLFVIPKKKISTAWVWSDVESYCRDVAQSVDWQRMFNEKLISHFKSIEQTTFFLDVANVPLTPSGCIHEYVISSYFA